MHKDLPVGGLVIARRVGLHEAAEPHACFFKQLFYAFRSEIIFGKVPICTYMGSSPNELVHLARIIHRLLIGAEITPRPWTLPIDGEDYSAGLRKYRLVAIGRGVGVNSLNRGERPGCEMKCQNSELGEK